MKRTDKYVVKYAGLGFVGALQIAFIVLKLCGVITWNWWLVMLPAIIYGSLTILIIILTIVLALLSYGKDY